MTIRQEIHNCIEDISESKLIVLKPLLFALAEESIFIENNLTDEERALVAKGMEEYENNPDSFVSLDDLN